MEIIKKFEKLDGVTMEKTLVSLIEIYKNFKATIPDYDTYFLTKFPVLDANTPDFSNYCYSSIHISNIDLTKDVYLYKIDYSFVEEITIQNCSNIVKFFESLFILKKCFCKLHTINIHSNVNHKELMAMFEKRFKETSFPIYRLDGNSTTIQINLSDKQPKYHGVVIDDRLTYSKNKGMSLETLQLVLN
jgi:hypothetical protein